MIHMLCVYLAFIIIPLTLLYLHLTRNFNYWKNRNVQYIKPTFLLGNIYKVLTFQRSIGQFLHDLYNDTTHPFIGFFIFDQPFLLIRDPEIIKRCLITDFEHFDSRTLAENKDDEIASNALFFLKNPTWKYHRVTVNPLYATGKIKGMLPLLLEATNDLVDYINNTATKQEVTETREVALKFTTDVIASCGFGINAHSFLNDKAVFREASRRMFDIDIGRKISLASYFIAPILVKLFKLKFFETSVAEFLKQLVKTIVAEKEKSKLSRGDLIDGHLQLRDQNRPGSELIDEKMLVVQAAQFFMAGFETTGSTISFALYELSLNPSVQNKLREEVQSVISNHRNLTYEALQEMKYLDMTIKETLRKYPPLSFLDRRCKTSYTIPGTDVIIEKGIPIYISLFGLHLDPEYFPNPERFDPERFSVENKSTRPAACYMPFGEGPRKCLGSGLGLLVAKVGLARILNEFEVEACKTTQIPLELDQKTFLLCPTNGINLHFKKISK